MKEHYVKVVARTVETDNIDNMTEEMFIFGGKAAGICYMPDDYLESSIQDKDKALKRAENNTKSGHHSVFDHGHISMLICTTKMGAMILNSLGVYATSEKSARYTVMKPDTQLELDMYNKWTEKFQEIILKKYPNTDDSILNARLCKKLGIDKKVIVKNNMLSISLDNIKDVENSEKLLNAYDILSELKKSDTLPSRKLAMENARYMISVFTPTTMMYTISFRQLFLTISYLEKLMFNCTYILNDLDKNSEKYHLHVKLRETAEDLKADLEKLVDDIKIKENKNQYIRFLEAQHVADIYNGKCAKLDEHHETRYCKEQLVADSYTLVYNGSLAMLAQAQRHRTIRHSMYLEYSGQFGFYVPEIIKDTDLEKEWLDDINSVSYCIPQGTLVRITEQGLFEDFALKCKERMCGRAQLEIMNRTKDSINEFIANMDKLCYENKRLLRNITHNLTPCARCMYPDFKCTEGCQWGVKEALTRKI